MYGCVGACLSFGATFVGITRTYHHTSRRAGPWIRILLLVVVVVVVVVFIVVVVVDR